MLVTILVFQRVSVQNISR